ncbi:MAG: hypothetical protein V4773_13600 [Verrucomicrobiota bacterium]
MDAASFPAPRVTPHPLHALGGLWFLTSRRFFTPKYWIMLAGMLAALVVLSLPVTENPEVIAREFIPFAAGFYVCFVVPILSFISAAGAVRDDLGAATIDYVFTRPVSRPLYLAFRYLTQMVCSQLDFLFGFAVIAGLGIFHHVPNFTAALPTLFLGQFMAVIVFSAFGCFCGMLTNRYIIVGLMYGALVEIGMGNVPTQINQISLVRHIVTLIRPVAGNEDGTFMQAPHVHMLPGSVPLAILPTIALLLAITVGLLAASGALFTVKQFTGAAAKEA